LDWDSESLVPGPLIFVESGGKEETQNHSFFNRSEALKIFRMLEELESAGADLGNIGVV
jgi:hypothetical protein